jgi:3-methyladenine DNA glycosylase Tag
MRIGSTFENDIKELDPRKAYKYLGIEKNFDIQHKSDKEKVKKEYLRRLRLVLGTELSAKNKIQAIGSLAVPIFRYSFGIVNWHQKNCKNYTGKRGNY